MAFKAWPPFCQGGASLEGLAFKALLHLLKNMPILSVPGKASSKKRKYTFCQGTLLEAFCQCSCKALFDFDPFCQGDCYFSCFCQAHFDSCQQSSSLRAKARCLVKCSFCSFLRVWFATCLCSGLLFEETSTMSEHLPLLS